MKALIIDNYDSFTYNLYQYVGELLEEKGRFELHVRRNNEISLEQIVQSKYDRIILSPGPGHPADPAYFGVCAAVIESCPAPLLGVCLGMQGMAEVLGGKVDRAHMPMHGKQSLIEHDGSVLFTHLPEQIEVMRYHSLVVQKLPDELRITARTCDDRKEIMAIEHIKKPMFGIQFHPESFGTEGGQIMLRNFLFAPLSVSRKPGPLSGPF
ncbi:MAG: aminodeoxychorismate/anthranilate synthase component II [Spirochaetales bacterium]|nr:aminodeoxychorismate/anthranilate synthase component II [Spirochaetales bacterium]